MVDVTGPVEVCSPWEWVLNFAMIVSGASLAATGLVPLHLNIGLHAMGSLPQFISFSLRLVMLAIILRKEAPVTAIFSCVAAPYYLLCFSVRHIAVGSLSVWPSSSGRSHCSPPGWSDDPTTRATAQLTLILGLLCPLHCPPRTLGITGIATTARGGIFHPVGLGLCGTPILPSHLGNGLRELHDSLNRLVYVRHP